MSGTHLPFQALTVKASGLAGRILTDVRVSVAFDPRKPPDPPPQVAEYKALWDTGASKSVVSPQVVADLKLTAVGKADVHHAGGKSSSTRYMVNFVLPNGVGIAGALVTELQGGPMAERVLEVIIGMDVITLGDFSITNVGGQTCMSFRTPSCVSIDYVAEAQRMQLSRVGRNDPCPCGKTNAEGKAVKFKKCHGA